jgi:hypothetical protein
METGSTRPAVPQMQLIKQGYDIVQGQRDGVTTGR